MQSFEKRNSKMSKKFKIKRNVMEHSITDLWGAEAQKGFTEVIRGTKVDMMMRPKIKFEIVVSSEEWERKTIEAIQKSAFTGEVGDGKIFSYEVRNVVKIRTGERDVDALQD